MNTTIKNWYSITNVEELDSPALVVYPDRVAKNLKISMGMLDDPARFRPHVKTHKSPDVAKMLMAAGIGKFKCATIAEAEMLGKGGAADVLLAYQPIGPKIKRLIALIHQYPGTKYSCLVDNKSAAEEMAAAFFKIGLRIEVFIDVNTGMNRTGIEPRLATQLYLDTIEMPGIETVGLHAYDGHLRDADLSRRARACDEAFVAILQLRDFVLGYGLPEPIIVAGGSPTYPIHSKREKVECSPGTFIYWDKEYGDTYSELPFVHAALLVTRVISLPDSTKICVDLGHKSVAAENELAKRVFFLNAPELLPVRQNEEHLVMEAGFNHHYQLGDVLYGIPMHICPTVALYERVYTIENHLVTGEWQTIARDRKVTV